MFCLLVPRLRGRPVPVIHHWLRLPSNSSYSDLLHTEQPIILHTASVAQHTHKRLVMARALEDAVYSCYPS